MDNGNRAGALPGWRSKRPEPRAAVGAPPEGRAQGRGRGRSKKNGPAVAAAAGRVNPGPQAKVVYVPARKNAPAAELAPEKATAANALGREEFRAIVLREIAAVEPGKSASPEERKMLEQAFFSAIKGGDFSCSRDRAIRRAQAFVVYHLRSFENYGGDLRELVRRVLGDLRAAS